MTVKKCYRGHKIAGANIQTAGKRERCRACRQANETTLRKPELRADIDKIADEKYANIMSGKKDTPGPARTATTTKKKPASRAKTTHQRSKSTKLNRYLEPVENMPSVDEVLRRMPNGCKRYLYEVDTPVNKWPSVIVSYLLKYDLARESKRPRNGETLILSKRGHEAKRRLIEKLKGR